MSMKKTYTCNICREILCNPADSFGLHFSDLRKFTFGAYGCTEGTHICYDCAKQLKEQLNSPEIEKILTSPLKPT